MSPLGVFLLMVFYDGPSFSSSTPPITLRLFFESFLSVRNTALGRSIPFPFFFYLDRIWNGLSPLSPLTGTRFFILSAGFLRSPLGIPLFPPSYMIGLVASGVLFPRNALPVPFFSATFVEEGYSSPTPGITFPLLMLFF